MEQEKGMPQEPQKNQGIPVSGEFQQNMGNACEGQMNMEPSPGYSAPSSCADKQENSHHCCDSSHSGETTMGTSGSHHPHPGMQTPGPTMGYAGHPHPGMQQAPGPMNTGHHPAAPHPGPTMGYAGQPHPGMQQAPAPGPMNMGHPGAHHPGQQPHAGMGGGYPRQGQSHCSCGGHQQFGPAHVSDMMGRLAAGQVTPGDISTVSSFLGIDFQSTRFWAGIALGAVGALLLTKAFKSE